MAVDRRRDYRDGEGPSTVALVLVATIVIAGAAGSAIMAYLMQA